jgi:hypothetical protein
VADPSFAATALSAGVGAVVAFIGAAGKNFLDARRKVDEDLRTRRDAAYAELWGYTQSFRRFPECDASYAKVEDLQRDLMGWHYQGGNGLYLSHGSQAAYAKLHKALKKAAATRGDKQLAANLSKDKLEKIRERCEGLHGSLTNDLLSRRSGRWFF